jgi:hypothetical protein
MLPPSSLRAEVSGVTTASHHALHTWRWKEHVSPKCWYPPTGEHRISPQKTAIWRNTIHTYFAATITCNEMQGEQLKEYLLALTLQEIPHPIWCHHQDPCPKNSALSAYQYMPMQIDRYTGNTNMTLKYCTNSDPDLLHKSWTLQSLPSRTHSNMALCYKPEGHEIESQWGGFLQFT